MNKLADSENNERTLVQGVLFYLQILLKRKKMILIGTSVIMVFILIFSIISLRLPPDISPLLNIYQAYGVVLFQEGGSSTNMSAMLSAFGVESNGGASTSSQLALQILQSRPFMDNIVNYFDLIEKLDIVEKQKTNARLYLRNNSRFTFNRDSGALVIAFTSIDPVFASEVVNYEISLLEKWFFEQSVANRSNELSLMDEKLEELASDMKDIESEIEIFQQEHGVLDIREIASAQSAMLTDLRTTLTNVELEIRSYSEYSTIEDPSFIRLKNQRNNIITQIRRIEAGYTSSDGRQMPSITELPQLSLTFTHLQAELSLKNQLYMTLSERYEVTKLMAADAGAFSILEQAEIPEAKIGPSRRKMVVTVTFGAFAGLIVLALLREYLQKLINDPENRQILLGEL